MSGPFFRELAGLLVGWALGLLSSPIIDWIRRRSDKPRITRALRTELRHLQDTLALVVIRISERRCSLTRATLEALRSTLVASGQVAGAGMSLTAIEGYLKHDDPTLAAFQARNAAGPSKSPSLKTYGLPYLESQLQRLELYSPETQRRLLEIRAGLDLFNQLAADSMRYHFMTFEGGISPENHDAVVNNAERGFDHAGAKANDLVTRIAELLQSEEIR
jgi:hypothetical protein